MARKRRKKIKTGAPIRRFCPTSMVRYNETIVGYSSVWICKICMVLVVSEKGVKDHILRCNDKVPRKKTEPEIEYFNPIYECDICNKTFRRLVILEKHKLDHVKPKQVYYELVPRKKRRSFKKKQVKKMLSPSKIKLEIKKEKLEIKKEKLAIKKEKLAIKKEKFF